MYQHMLIARLACRLHARTLAAFQVLDSIHNVLKLCNMDMERFLGATDRNVVE